MKWIAFLCALLSALTAHANSCETEAAAAEHAFAIPSDLLLSIGRVESGRRDERGQIQPWPWSVNAQGQGHYLNSAQEAIDLVRSLQTQGVRSIDVGCFQVNLAQHPEAFRTLEEAFDPPSNARAAGVFLKTLYSSYADWDRAVAAYHSADPALGMPYLRMVTAFWHGGPGPAAMPSWPGITPVRVFVPQVLTAESVSVNTASGRALPAGRLARYRLPIVFVP